MAKQFTPKQAQAIEADGHDILVAASAGSGKTTVLIERLLRKILAGQSVNSVLMVTFTNAAAAEMKARLESALQEALSQTQDPVLQKHLRQQLTLLSVAHISTIDAFALHLIEQYYYKIGLDPQFRLLSDTAEREMLRQEVIGELFSQHYDQDQPGYPDFIDLVNNFGNPNQDTALKEAVLKLADFAEARPDGAQWLAGLAQGSDSSKSLTETDLYQDYLYPSLLSEINRYLANADQLLARVGGQEALKKTEAGLTTLKDYLGELKAALSGSWDQIQAILNNPPKLTLEKKNSKGVKDDPTLINLLQEATDLKNDLVSSKGLVNDLTSSYFLFNEGQWQLVNQHGARLTKTLVNLTRQFQTAFTERKRADQLLDFADLVTLALQILDQDDLQSLIQSQFAEIMVDEYQDINQLQESLLQKLSNGRNLYMVGDVKQSIYGFRQADPSLFSTKYRNFAQADNPNERIELAENFRSQKNVAGITNLVFTQLMDQELGDIPYQDAARLIAKADFPSSVPPVFDLDLIQLDQDEEAVSEQGGDKRTVQYQHLAAKIKDLMANGSVYDQGEGTKRPVRFSDIAILTRSKGGYVELIRALNQAQIPVQAGGAGDYFQTMEIYIVLDVLKILDNPHQDIPLAAILRAPMFGFDENDLAEIRLADPDHDFWTAFTAYAKEDERAQAILAQLQSWQQLARQNDLVGTLRAIYEQTGWLDYVGAMPGGAQRQANLQALYRYAEGFQENQHAGLFRFIRYVELLQDSGGDLGEVSQETEEEAVSLMTIHASKGLEFPVVILPEFEKKFNVSDQQGTFLLQKDAGIGLDYVQKQAGVKMPTLTKLAVKAALKQQAWSEEMRLLYVALTRAKQQLYVIGAVNVDDEELSKGNLAGLWNQGRQSQGQFLPVDLRLQAVSYLDWLILSLARTGNPVLEDWFSASLTDLGPAASLGDQSPTDVNVSVQLIPASEISQAETKRQVRQAEPADLEGLWTPGAEVERAKEILSYRYPHPVATQTAAYQSVSEAKRLFEDPDRQHLVSVSVDESGDLKKAGPVFTDQLPQPAFMESGQQKPSRAAVGTATHLILQLLDFSQPNTEADLETLLNQLVDQGRISTAVADLVNLGQIERFLQSDFAQRVARHQASLHQEATFAMLMPAVDLYQNPSAVDLQADLGSDQILVHGIIDGYYIDHQHHTVHLFDYKTDYVRPGNRRADLEKIRRRYYGQLRLYQQALQQEYPDYQVQPPQIIALSSGDVITLDKEQ
ncbi:helicase-exonuclease AddAB subunit AddA [Leuconostocaceae bacterium ESL0723]|nr:helicase-exonuclease AddAB subunit AddA [Leuconostocaceae bacterium ESL0723]